MEPFFLRVPKGSRQQRTFLAILAEGILQGVLL